MSSNGTESLIFETFTKFKQWKETLKTDRGLQFTFQWSRTQNGSQYWRYTCKHVRLTNTPPHKFAYMMVAIEVDGRVQVELNAPNINQDLCEDARSPPKEVGSSETDQSAETTEAETEHSETVESAKYESDSCWVQEPEENVKNHDEAAQSEEFAAETEKEGRSEESDSEKDETSQVEKTKEVPKNNAQLETSGTNQDETSAESKLKKSGPNTEESDAGSTIEKETEISPRLNLEVKEDAQDDMEPCRSVGKARIRDSKNDEARDCDHKKPVVRHARPWESAESGSFDTRFDGSIEIAVEANPDLFLRNNENQPEENNSRKKFKNGGGTSNEIIQFSARNIDRVSEGSEQVAQPRTPNLFIRIALKFFSVSKRTQSVSPSG